MHSAHQGEYGERKGVFPGVTYVTGCCSEKSTDHAESTQRISDGTRTRYPEIEWRRIAAFRNVLVHDYLGIDLEKIWEIAQRDVPELETVVRRILEANP